MLIRKRIIRKGKVIHHCRIFYLWSLLYLRAVCVHLYMFFMENEAHCVTDRDIRHYLLSDIAQGASLYDGYYFLRSRVF